MQPWQKIGAGLVRLLHAKSKGAGVKTPNSGQSGCDVTWGGRRSGRVLRTHDYLGHMKFGTLGVQSTVYNTHSITIPMRGLYSHMMTTHRWGHFV